MNSEQLREIHRASPFRPFTIRMADGRAFDVRHPEFLAVAPNGRTAAVYGSEAVASILDVLLMTEIEFLSAPTGGDGRNGS